MMTNTADVATVYVVDDDPAYLTALSLLIKREGMQVQAYDNAEAFLSALPKSDKKKSKGKPNGKSCAVIDLRMPHMDGLQLQDALHERGIHLPIIFLTGYGGISESVKAMKGGAENFLTKPVEWSELLVCIQNALVTSETLYSQTHRQNDAKTRLKSLTARELEVMVLAAEGLPNKTIATRLNISLRTVEHHRTNILNKTEAASMIELARLAHESGLLFI